MCESTTTTTTTVDPRLLPVGNPVKYHVVALYLYIAFVNYHV